MLGEGNQTVIRWPTSRPPDGGRHPPWPRADRAPFLPQHPLQTGANASGAECVYFYGGSA